MITFVIFASGLKYAGMSTTALGWTLGAVLFAAALFWLFYRRPRQLASRAAVQAAGVPAEAVASARQPARIP